MFNLNWNFLDTFIYTDVCCLFKNIFITVKLKVSIQTDSDYLLLLNDCINILGYVIKRNVSFPNVMITFSTQR